MSPYALELKSVVKRYGKRRALDGLNLRVPRGSVFGLVGSNGAGKTTALSAVAGIVRTHGGAIDVLGNGPFDPARCAGKISLMPQDAMPPNYAKVLELLVFYAQLQGMTGPTARKSALAMLTQVNLADRAQSSIRSLSHGMRRRVIIAQAFLGNPELVLLDEPLSGLDPREVTNVRTMLTARKDRQTIVISSHNLHEIERICDHVAFIEKGRTVTQDTVDAVTGSTHSVIYLLDSEQIPLKQLHQTVPNARFTLEGRTLHCTYEGLSPPQINAKVLACLLAANVGIHEIRRGSELEHAYLAAADGRGERETLGSRCATETQPAAQAPATCRPPRSRATTYTRSHP